MAKGERRDRREQILTAAAELVAAGGFGAASVRAVAARAGLGASTVRYWFPTQEALSEAVATRVVHHGTSDRRMSDRGVPPVERLHECLSQYLPGPDLDQQQVTALCQAWFTLVQGAVSPTSGALARGVHAATVRTSRQRVLGWLDQLAEEGALAPAASARREQVAAALLTRLDGLMLGLLTPGADLDVATAVAVLHDDVAAIVRDPADTPA